MCPDPRETARVQRLGALKDAQKELDDYYEMLVMPGVPDETKAALAATKKRAYKVVGEMFMAWKDQYYKAPEPADRESKRLRGSDASDHEQLQAQVGLQGARMHARQSLLVQRQPVHPVKHLMLAWRPMLTCRACLRAFVFTATCDA